MRILFVTIFVVLFVNVGAVVTPVVASEAIVIAHRGASGYRPEHTIIAYQLAIEQGADFIEPDLVRTKDGHLVARHDIDLGSTTDIATRPEFADRKRVFEGKEDWYVFDFTLAEIKQLKAIQPRPQRGTHFDGIETVPTLAEIVSLVLDYKKKGVDVGLYIEMKRPDVFAQGDDLLVQLSAELAAIQKSGISLFFQCFDGGFLLEVGRQNKVPLIMLVGGKADEKMGWIKSDVTYELFYGKVAGFGLNKALLTNKNGSPSGVIERLHNGGALVHVWTVRNDSVPKRFQSVQQELKTLYAMGVDGVFTDFPDTAISTRESLTLMQKEPF